MAKASEDAAANNNDDLHNRSCNYIKHNLLSSLWDITIFNPQVCCVESTLYRKNMHLVKNDKLRKKTIVSWAPKAQQLTRPQSN